jgi:polysaccharide deacetylase family protein (PEP-CTERM system associated)
LASANARRSSPMALSVDVEDWFHTENMKGVVPREAWDGCELRVERNTMRMLEIFDAHNARATFFVLGWVAERCPQLVRAISAAGHEVASHGYAHELVYSLQPSQFRADILRSKKLLEDLTGDPVRGYRAPCFSITDWAITLLREEGFEYDSSMVPTLAHDRYGRLDGIDIGQPIVLLRDGLYEVCVSCLRLGRRGIPWGGGGYFRFIPYALWLRGVEQILASGLPYVFYIHPWEIDPGHPRVRGMKASNAFRQRVNLGRCEERLAALASAFHWVPIGKLLEAWQVEHTPRAAASTGKAVMAENHAWPPFAEGGAAVAPASRSSGTTCHTPLRPGGETRRALP